MSKIENYKKEKREHEDMIKTSYTAMNKGEYYRSNRDKYGLYIGDKWHDHGESMGYLTGHSGYYGNSGCSYQCTPRIAKYLKIVINKNMEELIKQAIELSAKDVEDVRLLAVDEAKSVLEAT